EPDVSLHRFGAAIERDDLVPAPQQALDHVATHLAEPDHGQPHAAFAPRAARSARPGLRSGPGLEPGVGRGRTFPGWPRNLLPASPALPAPSLRSGRRLFFH